METLKTAAVKLLITFISINSYNNQWLYNALRIYQHATNQQSLSCSPFANTKQTAEVPNFELPFLFLEKWDAAASISFQLSSPTAETEPALDGKSEFLVRTSVQPFNCKLLIPLTSTFRSPFFHSTHHYVLNSFWAVKTTEEFSTEVEEVGTISFAFASFERLPASISLRNETHKFCDTDSRMCPADIFPTGPLEGA